MRTIYTFVHKVRILYQLPIIHIKTCHLVIYKFSVLVYIIHGIT